MQDFAELFAYKILLNCVAKSSGLFQTKFLTLLDKYLTLATKLSRVSPVMSGATEASPQPNRPELSSSCKITVWANDIVSPDIFIGSSRGIERG